MDTIPHIALPDPIRAVIFDMDGTLLDTEAVHHRSNAEAAKALGHPLPDDVLHAMIGVNRDANAVMLAECMGAAFPLDRFHAEAEILFDAALACALPLRPGAQVILDHFRDTGMPLAIATSTVAPNAQERLEQAGLLHYFDVVVTRSDVTNAKPHPEPYLLAAHKLGVEPAACVAVEDSYPGVRSATAAGMATVMVPDLLPANEDMTLIGATILPSLSALHDLLVAPAAA